MDNIQAEKKSVYKYTIYNGIHATFDMIQIAAFSGRLSAAKILYLVA